MPWRKITTRLHEFCRVIPERTEYYKRCSVAKYIWRLFLGLGPKTVEHVHTQTAESVIMIQSRERRREENFIDPFAGNCFVTAEKLGARQPRSKKKPKKNNLKKQTKSSESSAGPNTSKVKSRRKGRMQKEEEQHLQSSQLAFQIPFFDSLRLKQSRRLCTRWRRRRWRWRWRWRDS